MESRTRVVKTPTKFINPGDDPGRSNPYFAISLLA
jgi:hypothetical protein